MTDTLGTPIALYGRAADAAANAVIDNYSTSFGWATRLLSRAVRQDVRNIYALVRVADEIVDGAAAGAGFADPAAQLDAYEAAVYAGMDAQFSTDLVIHAFARTARECGFGRDLIEPFFASMRADLIQAEHDDESLVRYIYGSAEVVGLMCLAAFLKRTSRSYSPAEKLQLAAGARALGSAFQKVNFLRDLATDFDSLGRSYFPGIRPDTFTDTERDRLVAEVAAELATAETEVRHLPGNCRRAVWAALALFGELNQRISATPAAQIARTRIRVPNARKAVILGRAYLGVGLG